jgi:acetyl esterase
MFGLDPALKDLLAKARAHPFDWKKPAADLRREFWKQAHKLEADGPQLLEVRNLTVQGAGGPLPARLYVPFAAGVTSPGLVFFHGGGFVLGDLDSHEMLCRRLAEGAKVRVLSVAYRLAPEHKFPAAPEDCIAAARWAFAHAAEIGFDPARIGVGGDSAGGNLTAVVAQAFKRDGALRLKAQLMLYPCTQFLKMTPSQLKFAEGYFLTQKAQDYFVQQYLGEKDNAYDWRASPLIADDLTGLPPAFLSTVGFDPLLDEGRAYADKLAASGVPTVYRHYANQVHGFYNMTAISKTARDAIQEAADWLASALNN